jgi:hypothetical protein
MTIELTVDQPEILERIKNLNPIEVIGDDFYSGLNFTLQLSDIENNLDIFGCWNSNCTDRFNSTHMGSHQQKTLSNILKSYDKKYPNKNKLRFLIGDNIYYDKDLKDNRKKNQQQLNEMTMNDDKIELDGISFVRLAKDLIDTGFQCFTESPSFMAIGNHDVEYPFILQYQIMKCFRDIQINENRIIFGNWILPNAFYSVKINTEKLSILFIILDTNLLEADEYINFFPKTKKDEYLSRMVLWFEKTLNDNNSSVKIVMGHVPIFYYTHIKNKEKKDKVKEEKKDKVKEEKKDKVKEDGEEKKKDKEEKKEKSPFGSRYKDFTKIYELMIKYNVTTYMCADEHNMQVLQDLEHGINHIICGASPGGGLSLIHISEPTRQP